MAGAIGIIGEFLDHDADPGATNQGGWGRDSIRDSHIGFRPRLSAPNPGIGDRPVEIARNPGWNDVVGLLERKK
jgi:hypothetical protein